MIEAEQNLDMFWWSFEIALADASGIDLSEILSEQTSPPRELYRTPKWKEPIQLPTPHATPQKPLSEINPNILYASAKSTSPTPTKIKEKIKTRGKPAAPDPRRMPIPRAPTEANNISPPIEKTPIPKKAYKVFAALLPSTTDVAQSSREIAWDELLWAMDAVGLEPEKLYGSVWMFKPLPKEEQGPEKGKVQVERSIQFHEPKEVRRGAKIPRGMVRTFGRRMKHAFGWGAVGEIFVEE